jgi:hypothetical protein
MGRPKSVHRELLAAVLASAIGIVGAVDLIGRPARTVHVLTIFFGGLGAGVALARAIDRLRAERAARRATVPPAV